MNLLPQFKAVTTFVFDIDGVLTDSSVLLLENGLQARRMNIKDGLALQMALRQGYRVLVVSGAASDPVRDRMHYLGIQEVHLGVTNKRAFLEGYISDHDLTWEEVLFMGDDLPDVPVLKEAGVACCPADAVAEARNSSHYISPLPGGAGCVRDVIEKVLRLNHHWYVDTEVTSR